jgi:hypothetical protein
MINDDTFLPDGGLIGFGLSHQYPVKDRFDDMDYEAYFPTSENKKAVQKVLTMLKGKDRVIYESCKDLGLDAYLRVIYQDGEGAIVMSEYIIDDRYAKGYEEDFLMTLVEGRRPVAQLLEDPCGYNPDALQIDWIIEKTTYNRLKIGYIAYGNEVSVGHVYGDFSLICKVGPAGLNRKRMDMRLN